MLLLTPSCASVQPTQKSVGKTGVRGVWLTNVASDALYSRENIKEAVELCHELGFNTIFVVTLNKAHTLYPSEVMKGLTGHAIMPEFAGRDPLQELLEEAHKKNIKVFAWFEFGFAASMGDSTGGILLQKKPHWASKDKTGNITTKNDFQWMNSFHPEVQAFVKSLVLEVVQKYDVDGIQGDDRLPALPTNGGYDDYTVNLYKSEHSGKAPPAQEKDYEWVKWRSGKLNLFLKDLVTTIRKEKPHMIVSMAPSIYPWSEENYLQDWPAWLNMGLVDLVIPQVYRYDFAPYQREMDKILEQQLGTFNPQGFYPGVLLQVDQYTAPDSLLTQIIDYNRGRGIQGEVYFFYEGIKKHKEFFKRMYPEPLPFPSLKNQVKK
ncbi:glycoside hydrolase family 10 protein [Nibribacter ruber]|uniref:glycoside hydrolase family 10 protein n=1 Tax=Nibribacter ruber TaxID=2698458 RepID=UPI001E2F39BA|nr:family 10 glycosylhydrolase [Nibribacter ruber]